MAESSELKKIKRIYGEKFARMCREMFPTILEEEGALLGILERKFSHNCNSLYESITENRQSEEFEALINHEFNSKFLKEVTEQETRTPYEILDEKGYVLFECKSEEDIQSFRKYYDDDEVLCTIYNGGRLKTRDCFFAVKKNVEEIRREDFVNPDKSDEYSTSVLGIQFSRNKTSDVQIISRYNHTVSNPNCTLNNNLDKLAPGLKQSFASLLKERGMKLSQKAIIDFEIPGYTLAADGKYYKYNMEINGTYYCPGNIVIFNGAARVVGEPEKGILMDYFYLDFQNKEIILPDEQIEDSFQDTFGEIAKIDVEKSDSEKVIKVYSNGSKEPVLVKVNKDSEIIGYENDSVIEIENKFLYSNESLRELFVPNVEKVGSDFLRLNKSLRELTMPKVEQIGDSFLCCNRSLSELFMLNVKQIGDDFLYYNVSLSELFMPNVGKVGSDFLCYNESLKELFMPNIEQAGDHFLYYNKSLRELSMPNVKQVGNNFLDNNTALMVLEMPKNPKLERLNEIVEKNKKIEIIKAKQMKVKEQEAEITELSKKKSISRESQQR